MMVNKLAIFKKRRKRKIVIAVESKNPWRVFAKSRDKVKSKEKNKVVSRQQIVIEEGGI